MSSADEQADYEDKQDRLRAESDAQYATVRIAEALEEICQVLHQIRDHLKADSIAARFRGKPSHRRGKG